MKVMSNHITINRMDLKWLDDLILRKRIRYLIDGAKFEYKNIDNLRFFIDAPILDKLILDICNCKTMHDIENGKLFGVPYFVENVPLADDVLKVTLKFDYYEKETEMPYRIMNPIIVKSGQFINFDAVKSLELTPKEISIKDVIFNDPATIVFWSDGTKTIVKVGEDESFDREKGLAMAISKKFLGTNESQSNFNNIFKKWIQ